MDRSTPSRNERHENCDGAALADLERVDVGGDEVDVVRSVVRGADGEVVTRDRFECPRVDAGEGVVEVEVQADVVEAGSAGVDRFDGERNAVGAVTVVVGIDGFDASNSWNVEDHWTRRTGFWVEAGDGFAWRDRSGRGGTADGCDVAEHARCIGGIRVDLDGEVHGERLAGLNVDS